MFMSMCVCVFLRRFVCIYVCVCSLSQVTVTNHTLIHRSGPITGTIHIADKSGFVAGEKINCQGEVANYSNVKINSWKMELIQVYD